MELIGVELTCYKTQEDLLTSALMTAWHITRKSTLLAAERPIDSTSRLDKLLSVVVGKITLATVDKKHT